jgi:hypothetical protein
MAESHAVSALVDKRAELVGQTVRSSSNSDNSAPTRSTPKPQSACSRRISGTAAKLGVAVLVAHLQLLTG